jgi:hypothetical protein
LTSKFQFIQVIPKSSVFVEKDANQGVDDQENREEKFEHGGTNKDKNFILLDIIKILKYEYVKTKKQPQHLNSKVVLKH